MKIFTGIQLLPIAFLTFVVCGEVMAAPPFTITKSGVTSIDTPVTGACQDYNSQLAGGVTLNSVNHPNFCQLSSAPQIVLNGLPFEKYWQVVSAGAVPPPYQVNTKASVPMGHAQARQI
jgi:hypothetical protein